MEITNKTKNTICEWCKAQAVSVDAEELENYKRFLALDGLDRTGFDDRLAVATMEAVVKAGELCYISGVLKSTIFRDMLGREETQYTPVFKDENKQKFYDALKQNNINHCQVIDRQRGRFYICYLLGELENKKAELLQQRQESEAKSKALAAEIKTAKEQKEQLEEKIKQLDGDLYRSGQRASFCGQSLSALKLAERMGAE